MKKMFLLFSHKLTDLQIEDAKNTLNVEQFISLPNDLQNKWSNVDPILYDHDKLDEIISYVELNGLKGDYVLVQGEWGFVYHSVNILKNKGFIPIYSTTEREVKEIYKQDGTVEKISLFKHVIYKQY